jgi:hypothetical protein
MLPRRRTQALFVLLRVCLLHPLRREPRRWPSAHPPGADQAGSVSPVPARIALQGGATRGHRCDSSDPRPRKKRANFRILSGRMTAHGPGPFHAPLTGGEDPRAPETLAKRAGALLPNPLNHIRKAGRGQFELPRGRNRREQQPSGCWNRRRQRRGFSRGRGSKAIPMDREPT